MSTAELQEDQTETTTADGAPAESEVQAALTALAEEANEAEEAGRDIGTTADNADVAVTDTANDVAADNAGTAALDADDAFEPDEVIDLSGVFEDVQTPEMPGRRSTASGVDAATARPGAGMSAMSGHAAAHSDTPAEAASRQRAHDALRSTAGLSPDPAISPAAGALVERVLRWHNRHPLAVRLRTEDVDGIGVVGLPYGQPAAAGNAPARGWRFWRRRSAARRVPLYAAGDLIAGLGHRAVARFGDLHGTAQTPGEAGWPRRDEAVVARAAGAQARPGADEATTVVRLHLLSAALVPGGGRPTRILTSASGETILGRRRYSPVRSAIAATLIAVPLVAGAWWAQGHESGVHAETASEGAAPEQGAAHGEATGQGHQGGTAAPADRDAAHGEVHDAHGKPDGDAAAREAHAADGQSDAPEAAGAGHGRDADHLDAPGEAGRDDGAHAGAAHAPVAHAAAAGAHVAVAATGTPEAHHHVDHGVAAPEADVHDAAQGPGTRHATAAAAPAARGTAATTAHAPSFALVTVPSPRQKEVADLQRQLKKALGAEGAHLQLEVVSTADGYMLTMWPLASRAEAQMLATELRSAGISMMAIDF